MKPQTANCTQIHVNFDGVKKYYPGHEIVGVKSYWHPKKKWITKEQRSTQAVISNTIRDLIRDGFERFELILKNPQSGLNHCVEFNASDISTQKPLKLGEFDLELNYA